NLHRTCVLFGCTPAAQPAGGLDGARCSSTGNKPNREQTNDKSNRIVKRGRGACTGRNGGRRPRASRRDRAGRLARVGGSARCRRQSSVHLSRQALLLVLHRMAGPGLVLVRLSLASRLRLGRPVWLARLAQTGNASTRL